MPTKGDIATKIKFEGIVSKFVSQNCKMAQRFMTLNSLSIFIYKDQLASKSFPAKPMIVIPLNEVVSVTKKTLPKKFIALESQMQKSASDSIFLIEIKLKRDKKTLE